MESDIIKNIDFNHSPKFRKNKIFLKQAYNLWKFTYSEIKYLVDNKNNLENLHIFCTVCGKKNNFIKYNRGYNFCCSRKCGASNIIRINKIKQTKLQRYGNENFVNPNKAAKTKELKYGNSHFVNPEKAKQTNLKRRGVIHHLKLEEYKQQKRDLWKDKEWVNKNIEHNQISKLFNHGFRGWNNSIKAKQTNLKKYGAEHHTKTQKYKDLFKDKEWVSKIVEHRYKTERKNNSFGTSKPEDECYNSLLNKFKQEDIIRQYKSKLYPFKCDFYIKSLDLYIECHFYWTHCNEPFNVNNKYHKKLLEDMKNKNSTFYKNAIINWTIRDPLKLKTFQDNKLNYKIFYKKEEFNKWFEKI